METPAKTPTPSELIEALTGAQLVNLPALKEAWRTLRDHEPLLVAAALDLTTRSRGEAEFAFVLVREALRHVIDNEFRSDETRGGS